MTVTTNPTFVEFFVRPSETTSGMRFTDKSYDEMMERANNIIAAGNAKFYQFRNDSTGERWSWKKDRHGDNGDGWINHQPSTEPNNTKPKRDNKGRFVKA